VIKLCHTIWLGHVTRTSHFTRTSHGTHTRKQHWRTSSVWCSMLQCDVVCCSVTLSYVCYDSFILVSMGDSHGTRTRKQLWRTSSCAGFQVNESCYTIWLSHVSPTEHFYMPHSTYYMLGSSTDARVRALVTEWMSHATLYDSVMFHEWNTF